MTSYDAPWLIAHNRSEWPLSLPDASKSNSITSFGAFFAIPYSTAVIRWWSCTSIASGHNVKIDSTNSNDTLFFIAWWRIVIPSWSFFFAESGHTARTVLTTSTDTPSCIITDIDGLRLHSFAASGHFSNMAATTSVEALYRILYSRAFEPYMSFSFAESGHASKRINARSSGGPPSTHSDHCKMFLL